MYSVESYLFIYFFTKEEENRKKKKRINHTVKHRQKYKHCPEKTMECNMGFTALRFSTWLQEADNDSCGWYVTKKKEVKLFHIQLFFK